MLHVRCLDTLARDMTQYMQQEVQLAKLTSQATRIIITKI